MPSAPPDFNGLVAPFVKRYGSRATSVHVLVIDLVDYNDSFGDTNFYINTFLYYLFFKCSGTATLCIKSGA
jgi:hypothetical protein